MTKAKKVVSKVSRRTPKRLSHTLYSYVEPINGKWARNYGKEHFGSFSAYLDILIAIDRKSGYTAKLIANKEWTGKAKLTDGKVHVLPTFEKNETTKQVA